MQQASCFRYESAEQVRDFLRTLGANAHLNERDADFFVFTQLPGKPSYSCDFALAPAGLLSVRSGNYFEFLGLFVEAATGTFGTLTIEDSWPE